MRKKGYSYLWIWGIAWWKYDVFGRIYQHLAMRLLLEPMNQHVCIHSLKIVTCFLPSGSGSGSFEANNLCTRPRDGRRRRVLWELVVPCDEVWVDSYEEVEIGRVPAMIGSGGAKCSVNFEFDRTIISSRSTIALVSFEGRTRFRWLETDSKRKSSGSSLGGWGSCNIWMLIRFDSGSTADKIMTPLSNWILDMSESFIEQVEKMWRKIMPLKGKRL